MISKVLTMSEPKHGFADKLRRIVEDRYGQITNMKKALDYASIVAITDKDGMITYVNDKFCKISKYSRDELIGQNHRILKSGYHPESFYKGIWKAITSGNVWHGDIKNTAKDGSYYWVKTGIVPILGKDGKPEQFIAIRIDITKQKEVEKDLRLAVSDLKSNEEKFRDLYENSPNLLRTIDSNGKIIDCNQVYAKTLGYTKKEIIGSSIFDHVPKEKLDVMKESFETWKQIGRIGGKEVVLQRKDGTSFPVLLSAAGIYNKKGDLIGSNTSIINLSEMHKARKEVEKEKIKRLTAIGELSARIAHDLRNPMSVIKNTMEIVEMDPDIRSNKKIQSKFDRINRAITRINHQVENVLDFVRDKPLTLENTSLKSILSFVIDRINVPKEVKINLPENDVDINCDFEKLEIVFVNLITNAIQAMSNKGEINITINDEGDYNVVKVNDSGPGIPEDHLPKVFDPLFTTRQIGTGLGLPSCKTIVEKHGGTIEIETEIGKGTTFVIKLPKKTNLVTVDTD